MREIEVAIFSELLGAASHPTSMGLAVPHISAQFLFGSLRQQILTRAFAWMTAEKKQM